MADRAGTVLALIPARGGSKGVPGKNIKEVAGKPLIAWTIEAAQQARCIDRVVVSSDDAAILEVARAWGAETPFERPAELARDETPSIDVVLHAVRQLPGAAWVVLLQPTSPLRTAQDIDAAFALCRSQGAPACVSVTEAATPPWWMFHLTDQGRLRAFLPEQHGPQRRQDAPPLYSLNGAVYVARTDWLQRTRTFLSDETLAYAMPAERSIDIDTPLDLTIAACLLRAQTLGRGS
ncbi:MAG: acylneuraminate cytidylyltransferase family protein [Tepidimonas sp.]|uniref:acylneuraminate cytidylyltransferase family protein n=1 Tax=Tepidimonas sp. TaxID=2002775 RepID=UPI00259EEA26|nr:acylneuraminate cytidylyltransferase family protein [Tepidimonas sp.]MDM7456730.1 acylneuraminate cytidylyltransferase family protein [Tepidimonas sp.]